MPFPPYERPAARRELQPYWVKDPNFTPAPGSGHADALVRRRQWLCEVSPMGPVCPRCGENQQIQLIAYFYGPAKWRCRTCRNPRSVFEFEPPNRPAHAAPIQ